MKNAVFTEKFSSRDRKNNKRGITMALLILLSSILVLALLAEIFPEIEDALCQFIYKIIMGGDWL